MALILLNLLGFIYLVESRPYASRIDKRIDLYNESIVSLTFISLLSVERADGPEQ